MNYNMRILYTYFITGSFSLVWSLIWFAFVSSSPKLCRWVTVEERIYIERSNGLLEHSTNEVRAKFVIVG